MKKLLIIAAAVSLFTVYSFTKNTHQSIVVIDASHGGSDNGAAIEQVKEKDITLAVAQKIYSLNKNQNVKIMLLRDKDVALNLEERVNMISDLKPEMVISLHANFTSDQQKEGLEIMVSEGNKFYQESLSHAQLLKKTFNIDGRKSIDIKQKSLRVLNNAPCPAVSVELGYISNVQERSYLQSEEGQQELAEKILKTLIQ